MQKKTTEYLENNTSEWAAELKLTDGNKSLAMGVSHMIVTGDAAKVTGTVKVYTQAIPMEQNFTVLTNKAAGKRYIDTYTNDAWVADKCTLFIKDLLQSIMAEDPSPNNFSNRTVDNVGKECYQSRYTTRTVDLCDAFFPADASSIGIEEWITEGSEASAVVYYDTDGILHGINIATDSTSLRIYRTDNVSKKKLSFPERITELLDGSSNPLESRWNFVGKGNAIYAKVNPPADTSLQASADAASMSVLYINDIRFDMPCKLSDFRKVGFRAGSKDTGGLESAEGYTALTLQDGFNDSIGVLSYDKTGEIYGYTIEADNFERASVVFPYGILFNSSVEEVKEIFGEPLIIEGDKYDLWLSLIYETDQYELTMQFYNGMLSVVEVVLAE